MDRLREVSEADPEIEEMGGFDEPRGKPPPRIKMAILTLVAVCPLSMLYPRLVVPVTPAWPYRIRGAVIAALIVVSLTWFIMPGLPRLFEKWLFASIKKD